MINANCKLSDANSAMKYKKNQRFGNILILQC